MWNTLRNIRAKLLNKRALTKVKRDIESIEDVEFCIISSNCIGSKIYQMLNLTYNTPTVGLFLYAPCFVKFASDLALYLGKELVFSEHSLYPEGDGNRANNGNYPLGRLGDIEIHFLHYKDQKTAKQTWNSLCSRVDYDRLFFIFTDRDLCTPSLLESFDNIPHKYKVCFTAKKYDFKSCVQIEKYCGQEYIGDIYTEYGNFYKNFSFSKWLDKK